MVSYRDIPKVDPSTVMLTGRLGGWKPEDNEHVVPYRLYAGKIEGKDVVVKPPGRRSLYEEAERLFTLQGVPCVPRFYGVLDAEMILDGKKIRFRDAIVEEMATGKNIGNMKEYGWRDLFIQVGGHDFVPGVTSELAVHYIESLKRGILTSDLKDSEVFLDFDDGRNPKVIRIDYDSGLNRGSYLDSVSQPIMGGLLLYAYDATFEDERRFVISYDNVRSLQAHLKPTSQKLRTDGETLLPDLMDGYIQLEPGSTDSDSFSRFLERLAPASEEHSQHIKRSAPIKRQERVKVIMDRMEKAIGITNLSAALEYLRDNGYKLPLTESELKDREETKKLIEFMKNSGYPQPPEVSGYQMHGSITDVSEHVIANHGLTMASELGRVPDYLREDVKSANSPFLDTMLGHLGERIAPVRQAETKKRGLFRLW